MQKEDKKRLWFALKTLAMNSGVDNPDKDTARMYFETLKNYTIDQVENGCKKVLLTWEYSRMPPIAIIIKSIDGEQPKIEFIAIVEADKILSHLKFNGASSYPVISDPITKHLMGQRWPYCRWAKDVLESELVWWKKEFIATYQAHDDVGEIKQIKSSEGIKKLIEDIGTIEDK